MLSLHFFFLWSIFEGWKWKIGGRNQDKMLVLWLMTWWKSCNFKKCDYNFSFFFIPTKLLIHWSQGFPVFSHVILSKKCCYICHFLSESLKKTHILSKVSFKTQVKNVALTAFQIVVLENAPLCNECQIETADMQCMGRFGHLKMLWSNSLSVLPRRKPTNEWKYFFKKQVRNFLLGIWRKL